MGQTDHRPLPAGRVAGPAGERQKGLQWIERAAEGGYAEAQYRLEYQKAVNGLNRGDGSREGQRQYRARVEQLRQKYIRQREQEIEKITGEDY